MFLIDGYNLIGASHHFKLSDPDKEDRMITCLAQAAKAQHIKIRVIFDGKGEFESSYQNSPNLHVVFTPKDSSADDYMMNWIQQTPPGSHYRIVTSDREIVFAAKKKKFQTLSSTQFIRLYLFRPEVEDPDQKPQTSNRNELDYWLNQFSG